MANSTAAHVKKARRTTKATAGTVKKARRIKPKAHVTRATKSRVK